MKDYLMNLTEFEKEFNTEEQCREYLFKLRWEDGYHCPRCQCDKAWQVSGVKYKCHNCGYQTSVIAGTIFQDTHKPLTLWFRAIWYVTSQKNGTSALNLQRILGLGSYETAWTWLHKLRRAMVRQGRDKLNGAVEVDEAFIGAPGKGGKRGRGAENKVLLAVAVEISDKKIGRIRMGVIDSASSLIIFFTFATSSTVFFALVLPIDETATLLFTLLLEALLLTTELEETTYELALTFIFELLSIADMLSIWLFEVLLLLCRVFLLQEVMSKKPATSINASIELRYVLFIKNPPK
jgi:transposase-like protein